MKYEVGDIVVVCASVRTTHYNNDGLGVICYSYDQGFQIADVTWEGADKSSCYVRVTADDLTEANIRTPFLVNTEVITFVEHTDIEAKKSRIKMDKIDSILRCITSNAVRNYYRCIRSRGHDFVPGTTYVRYGGRVYDEDEMVMLADSTLDFWLTAGRYAKKFEDEFAGYLGVKYCMLTNSGSSANLLAVSSLMSSILKDRRLRAGDEIITTACAFPTTVNPIIQNNLVPVFVDVSLGDYNIQVDEIEEAISEKTKGIFISHTLGNPVDLRKLMKVVGKHNLWLIEDNCDSVGSLYDGRYTGTFGHIATYSFYPPHHITMGEGGALTTNDSTLRRIILSFRDWGRDCWCEPGCDNSCNRRFGWHLGGLPYGYDHKYIYSHVGYNLRVTDMQAAVGVAQLQKLPAFIEARQKNWLQLYDGLKDLDTYFILPEKTRNSVPSWFGFVLTVREGSPFSKNDIVCFLEKNKIATRMLFAGNIIRQPYFADVKYRVCGDLSNTDFIMHHTFWLGVYPGLTRDVVSYVIEKIRDFVHSC